MSAWKVRARAELARLEKMREKRQGVTVFDAGWAAGAAYALAWMLDPGEPTIYLTPSDHYKQESEPRP